jgi:hypothetical protein
MSAANALSLLLLIVDTLLNPVSFIYSDAVLKKFEFLLFGQFVTMNLLL